MKSLTESIFKSIKTSNIEPISQSLNQSKHQSLNQSSHLRINQFLNQSITNQPTNQATNQSTKHPIQISFLNNCIFQHTVFAFTSLLAWLIPDVPKRVANQIKRENFLAREALRTQEVPDSVVTSPSSQRGDEAR